MKRRVGVSIAVLVAAGLGALVVRGWWIQRQPRQSYGPVEKITIAAYAGDTAALVWLAQENAYFAENGLEVTVKPYEAGKLAADALLAGEADISTSADFVFVRNSFNHSDLRVIGTVATAEITYLVARKDRNIERPADLRGKRVGVTRKSVGEFFLGTFLIFNGLSIKDVNVVDLKPSGIVEALSAGEIDAGLTWEPNVQAMQKRLGSNSLTWPAQSGQGFYFILIGKDAWVESHQRAVERLLGALVMAEEFGRSDPDAAKGIVMRKFGLGPEYVRAIWPKHNFSVELPQGLILVMEDQARWAIASGLTEEGTVPNYLEAIYMDALDVVRPEAVTIIR